MCVLGLMFVLSVCLLFGGLFIHWPVGLWVACMLSCLFYLLAWRVGLICDDVLELEFVSVLCVVLLRGVLVIIGES